VAERPRVYNVEGVILRRRNIGEADSIFTVLSPHAGKFDAVARGVRKPRSRMRGHLEPLTRSKLLLARGRTLDVFTQAETLTSYRGIHDDLELSAAALYCAELVDRFTAEHVEQPGIYELLLDTLDALEAGAPPHVVRHYEIHLLLLTGFELQFDACAVCGARLPETEALLSGTAGGLVCAGCRPLAGGGRLVGVRGIKVLRFARANSIARMADLRIGDDLGRELRAALGDAIRVVLDHEVHSGRFVEQVGRLAPRTPAEPAGDVQSITPS
jgi:DNA repair protein RecO (recombination protein O)